MSEAINWGYLALFLVVLSNLGVLVGYLFYRKRRASAQDKALLLEAEANDLKWRESIIKRHAYDMRNQLSSVIGLGELLADPESLPDYFRQLNAYRAAAGELQATSSNLLTFLQPADETRSELTAPVDMREILAQVQADTQPSAVLRSVQVDLTFAPSCPRRVLVQGYVLSRVVSNVIRHAIAFTTVGTIDVTLCESVGPKGLRLTIRDGSHHHFLTQRGLSRDIFGPYGLEAKTGATYGTGAGLHLWVAKHLAEAIGGTVVVKGVDVEGILFELWLPAEVLSIEDPITDAASTDKVTPINDPFVRHRRRVAPLRALVVDNQSSHRVMEASYLERGGHTVTSVSTGEEGLQKLAAEAFDLVVIDNDLAEMSGPDFLRRDAARAGGRNRNIPIIVVSGDLARSKREDAYRAGATVYLTKPLAARRLLEAVEEVADPQSLISRTDLRRVTHGETGPSRAQVSALEGLMIYRKELDKAVAERDWTALRRHARAIRGAAAQSDVIELGGMVELCSRLIVLKDTELVYEAGSLCREIGFEIDAVSRISNKVRFE